MTDTFWTDYHDTAAVETTAADLAARLASYPRGADDDDNHHNIAQILIDRFDDLPAFRALDVAIDSMAAARHLRRVNQARPPGPRVR